MSNAPRSQFFPIRIGAVAAAGAVILAACGDGSPETSADGGSVFTLQIGSAVPASTYPAISHVSEIFVKGVEERVAAETTHEIEFAEQYGTVVGVGEELDALSSGQLDMGTLGFAYQPSELPLHNVNYYVPFSSPDATVSVAAYREVYENNEEFAQIIADKNQLVLGFYTVGNYGLGTNFPVDDVEAVRGQEIAGVGANLEWLAPVNINPVQAPSTEWYSSFQTGVYDGVVTFTEGFNSLRLYEVLSHYLDMSFGAMTLGAVTVNLDTWEELPPEVQDIVLEVGREFETESAERVNEAVAESIDVMVSEGVEVVEADRDLITQWAESLGSLPRDRAAEMDDTTGTRLGSDLIASFIRAQEELGHEYPYPYEVGGQE